MSKINHLIKRLCPDGVIYKKLWELTNWNKKFQGVATNKQTEVIKYPHVSARKLKSLAVTDGTIKLLSTGDYEGYTNNQVAGNFASEGEIIAIPSGGRANIKYHKGQFVNSYNYIATVSNKDILLTKYLFYFLIANNRTVQNFYRGSNVQHPDMAKVLEINIPLPHIKIQQKIVKILNSFTWLEAELEAELEARKQQYTYYRTKLLAPPPPKNQTLMTLNKIFDMKNGYTPSKKNLEYWTGGTIPWFRMDDIRKNGRILNNSMQHITVQAVKASRLFRANSVILATTATIGEHALITVDFLANQQFTILSLKPEYANQLDMNWFYYYCFIIGDWCRKNTNTSGFQSVNMAHFKKLKIPIPPLKTQKRIAVVLDSFEQLTNDISEGLPAELNARRQQYQYYRDKLLTFKELRL